MKRFDIGVVGLGVMGANLALNLRDHGFPVAGYDANAAHLAAFAAAHGDAAACASAGELAACLTTTRRVLVMVPAGPAVDDVIAGLLPHLSAGDVVVDGGNSYFKDTERRAKRCA
ncbi:MAG: NAD(P)-binding domain-containing protein, partial [Candidatus Hydrogenedentales bacterium]